MTNQQFVTTGVYNYIRHPIYFGDVLLFLGLQLALNSWLVLGVFALMPFVVVQTKKEEEILLKAFPGYHSYKQKTKAFIPFLL